MAKWGVDKRVVFLRDFWLKKNGIKWHGTEEQFLEVLLRAIDCMPPEVADAMRRYYIDGGTQYRSETTGRPQTQDSQFYHFLDQGRVVLASLVKIAQEDSHIYEILGGIYGW